MDIRGELMNESSIRYSMIIPVFNIENYLPQCLDSILHSDREDIQIVLVDDGSSDNSGNICDAYSEKDQRVKVVHKKNEGATSARREAVKYAIGRYIICVDGDDWIDEDFLEEYDHVIQQFNTPDIICCGFKKAGESVQECCLPYKPGYYDRKQKEELLFPSLIADADAKSFPRQLWAKAFKRELFSDAIQNLNTNLIIGEDAACVIPMVYKAESIFLIEKTLYYYRYNPSSLTKSKKANRWSDIDIWYEKISRNIDISSFDFTEQVHRYIFLSVFEVASSQFNLDLSYFNTVKKIKQNLNSELYQESIKRVVFNKGNKHNIKVFLLRKRMFLFLYLYCTLVHNRRV